MPVNCISLYPLSDSHLASRLDTSACEWMVWKEWGKAGSVSLGKGQGLWPFDNACQGLARTHPASSEWESLQPPLSNLPSFCTLGRGINDQMLDLMQNRHNALLASFPPLILLLLLCGGYKCLVMFHFVQSHPIKKKMRNSSKSPVKCTSGILYTHARKNMLHQQLSPAAVSSSNAVSPPTTTRKVHEVGV